VKKRPAVAGSLPIATSVSQEARQRQRREHGREMPGDADLLAPEAAPRPGGGRRWNAVVHDRYTRSEAGLVGRRSRPLALEREKIKAPVPLREPAPSPAALALRG
jgi:hypothetical protein